MLQSPVDWLTCFVFLLHNKLSLVQIGVFYQGFSKGFSCFAAGDLVCLNQCEQFEDQSPMMG